MSCIRFKLKSSLEYDKVTFDGLQISVGDLRKKIMAQKKLMTTDNFTLQIMDAQSRKIYSSESEMVPRNTSVVIMRVPVVSAHKNPKIQTRDISVPKDNGFSLDNLKKTGDLANADATEEEKVLAMMSQAGEEYNQANYAKFKPRGGTAFNSLVKQPPPSNYVCHRCGQKGHWIKFCPTNGDPNFDNPRIKPPSGIPKSQVVHVTSNTAGAMKDRQGNLVKRKVDMLTDDGKPKSLDDLDTSVPQELTCSICKELIKDAVIIPCCGESFCDECIREYLLENEFKCFACEETDVSPDTLVPNKRLRNDAKKFQSGLTQKKRLAVTRGLPGFVINDQPQQQHQQTPPQAPPVSKPSEEDELTNLSVDPVKSPSVDPTPKSPSPAPPTSPKRKSEEPPPRDTPTPPTPPLPPSPTNKSQVTMSTKAPITQPISLYSNTRPMQSAAATVPPGLLTTPAIISNPLGLSSVVQPTLFPQSMGPPHGGLLPVIPQFATPTIVAATPTVIHQPPPPMLGRGPSQTAANTLLQAAALSNSSSGSGASSLDPNQMARLAELLVAAEARKKSPSPAPLSFEEFQRQQKVLRGLDIPVRKPPRADSPSDSYSSYSSRSPTPTRKGRGRSYSRSPDGHDHRRSHHSGSSRSSKRHRYHSPSEDKSKRKHKHKSSSSSSGKKRKHHSKIEDYLSHEDEGAEFQESKAKRHKRKKHRHSKKDLDDVINGNEGREEERVSLPNGDLNEGNSIEADSKEGSSSAGLEPSSVVPSADHTPSVDHAPSMDYTPNIDSSKNSEESPNRGENKVLLNKLNSDGDDTASGGSTPVLLPSSTPYQESLSLGPPSSPIQRDDVVTRHTVPKQVKKSKHHHKHRSKRSGSKEERDHKRHHKVKKHHRHHENGDNGHRVEKKKKSYKKTR